MRNDNIARSLRYYRNVNHKSIDDIIAFLREHDYDVSEKPIYATQNASTPPRAHILNHKTEKNQKKQKKQITHGKMVLTSLAQISSCSYANITR